MTGTPSPSNRLLQMLDGYRVVQALYAAAQLGIPDRLRDGPRRSDELSLELGVHERSLRRLLRALASLDVVEERPSGEFALAEVGELLRTDVPGSLHAAVVMYGG